MRDARFFQGPAGRLDARLHGPEGGPSVLFLHPHPLFGGTMGSRMVHDAAVAVADAGGRAVRFDFRGVGRSEGSWGDGVGETEDAVAVFDAVAAESGRPPAVVGYSFGGAVACRLAALRRPERLVLLATPLSPLCRLVPLEDAPRVACPVHVVCGTRDPHVPVADAERLAAAFRPPAPVAWVEDAGHLLAADEVRRAVPLALRALGLGA